MRDELYGQVSWIQKLAASFTASFDGKRDEGYSESKLRTLLVAKIRWILLVVFGVYSVYAGTFFFFSTYGTFFTPLQLILLFLSAAGVILYNSVLYFNYDRISSFPLVDQLQILLDLVFVTVLVHLSGGGASWFWAVYLIVTMESSFLLDRKRDVWLVGAFGGILYGGLLVGEYLDVIPSVKMPFVDEAIHNDLLYLVLIWLWVSLLNATMAVIGSFFMAVIRQDNLVLRESEERLVKFLDSAHDLIQCTSADGSILYANRAWEHTLGYSRTRLSGLSFGNIVSPECRFRLNADVNRALNGETVPPFETNLMAHDGRQVVVEGTINCTSGPGGREVWSICRDITEKKLAQEQLYHLAHHDILTGLPNRILFIDRLGQARALAHRLGHKAAVLFLDLDRFKVINDTLGHPIGDKLLQATASRLKGCVREIDTIARIGGDEFVVILVNVLDIDDVESVAQKILAVFSDPFLIDGHELFITTTVGICLFPDDGDDPVSLVKKADIAMYHGKSLGRNNYQLYKPFMDENADKKLILTTNLRKGLERGEFFLVYQPKVDAVTGSITALEALLRWQHPEMGVVMPNDFIPVAEETGLIVPLGDWVLREACRQNVRWQEEGLRKIRVAVNLSAYQLQQKNLIESIKSIIEETGLEPELLEIEITESVIMQDPDFAVQVLSKIREVGIHISIDDFGTGYSSLSHLKRFSVNTLKIDRSFVRDVEINSTDAAIATAIIVMGNSLNLTVIAEGVETEGQFKFLKDKNCDEMQGFLFSAPVAAERVPELMKMSALMGKESKGNGPKGRRR